MPATPINALTDRRLFNGIVDKRIKPYTALFSLLFPEVTRKTLSEEFAQVDVLTGTYGMAPFVQIGQRAILMDSINGTSYTIETPFINIKRTLKYGTRMAKRLAGQPVFSNGINGIMDAINIALAEDADYMNTLIDNREEWMTAMLLQNNLSYSQDGYASFTVDTGKPGGNTVTAPVLWTMTDGTAVPLKDIKTIKKLAGSYRGPMPGIAIGGAKAGDALGQLIELGLIPSIKTDSGVIAGAGDLRSQLEDNGMMFIARLGNVDFYEYTGTYTADGSGATTALIRTEYFEFFSTASQSVAMRDMFYGLIPDLQVILEGQAQTRRHGIVIPPKPDQGTLQGVIKTRPLPWFKRADWQFSLKVTA